MNSPVATQLREQELMGKVHFSHFAFNYLEHIRFHCSGAMEQRCHHVSAVRGRANFTCRKCKLFSNQSISQCNYFLSRTHPKPNNEPLMAFFRCATWSTMLSHVQTLNICRPVATWRNCQFCNAAHSSWPNWSKSFNWWKRKVCRWHRISMRTKSRICAPTCASPRKFSQMQRYVHYSGCQTREECPPVDHHTRFLFHTIQLYICWMDKQTLHEVTYKRYGSVYPWPLNHIQNWRKRRHIENKLKIFNWASYTSEQVVKKVRKCCSTLTEKLGPNKYFYGDTYVYADAKATLTRMNIDFYCWWLTLAFPFFRPTELDALVFGHIFTILTTPLPNSDLQQMIKNNFRPLVDFCDRIEREFFKKWICNRLRCKWTWPYRRQCIWRNSPTVHISLCSCSALKMDQIQIVINAFSFNRVVAFIHFQIYMNLIKIC